MKVIVFWFKFHFGHENLIGIKSLLVQVMAWCQIGTKSLAETIITLLTDAYMCH